MHLARLELHGFRTFRHLEIDLQRGAYVVAAGNARGKTNLLEAIALLATARSPRAASDLDLISWAALEEDPLPAARISGRVESAAGSTTLDVAIIARPAEPTERLAASRRFRVNGLARRASDLIGHLRVVLFAASDLGIIAGPPVVRRRYLDITLSQLDPAYVRALQRYQRVLQQRNSLLRRIQERHGAPADLEFWDGELSAAGAVIVATRARALAALAAGAAERYAELSPGSERLAVCYRPALPETLAAAHADAGEATFAEALRALYEAERREDIAAGVTRRGPHRDDVAFLLAGRDAGVFASRGEQRGAAIALRLAEVALSTARTGDPPLLLLDDILSELDAERRARVLAVAHGVEQVIITTPDQHAPSGEDLPGARRYGIVDGGLAPLPARSLSEE